MWREEAFCFGKNARDGVDSDQSFSEEDEGLESQYTGNVISLGGTADKSEGMQVLSQLEILRDSCKQFANEKECFSLHKRKAGCFSEDEVENPLFDDEDGSTSPPKFASASHSIQGVMHLPVSSKSHYHDEIISDGEALQESCSPILRSGAAAYSKTNKFVADSQLTLFKKESEKPDNHAIPSEVVRKDNIKQNSVAESLAYFYDNCATHTGNPELDNMKRGAEAPMVPERKASLSGYGILDEDDDELPEAFDDSSGDEENPQHPKLAIPVRTMADQFCEAFGTVSGLAVKSHLTLPGPLCGSTTNGKLQLLIQAEKERDIEYMKNVSAGTSSTDERNSIKVRIMSRHLEAKLVVCSCTAIGDDGKAKGTSGSLTIIFNPRICSHVELEVDNVICIHSPWKEVQGNGKDEVVLLSSYYCRTHF